MEVFVIYRWDDKSIEFVTSDWAKAEKYCLENRDAFGDTVFNYKEFTLE